MTHPRVKWFLRIHPEEVTPYLAYSHVFNNVERVLNSPYWNFDYSLDIPKNGYWTKCPHPHWTWVQSYHYGFPLANLITIARCLYCHGSLRPLEVFALIRDAKLYHMFEREVDYGI